MWPIARQLYDEAPIFQGVVIAACAVTAIALFSGIFSPTGQANASSMVPPIPTGPATYLSPYPTPPAIAPAPAGDASASATLALQAKQPVVTLTEAPKTARPLIDTSSITEAPSLRRQPHAVAPGAVRSYQPRPLIEP